MKTVAEIKQLFEQTPMEKILTVLEAYRNDERKNVQSLIKSFENKFKKYTSEQERLLKITEFERYFNDKGYKLIAGVDEVGRGPLAGPVVTAAVILPEGTVIEGVDDSKKLSEKKREELFKIIKQQAVAVSIGIESEKIIDDINILNATYKAMKKAVESLDVKPDLILVDAVTIPGIDIEQKGIIKGDSKSISIAAASIIAKVTRDKMMELYAEQYPQYSFEKNKGYGSSEHIKAIEEYGLCPIHRKSFTKNFVK